MLVKYKMHSRRESPRKSTVTQNGDLMGWFLVSIVLPLIAPNILLMIFGLLPLPARTQKLVKWAAPIKDGQLCWAAAGFCASGLYELSLAKEVLSGGTALPMGYVQSGLILLLVMSSFIAAGGAVFPSKLEVPSGAKWYKHYKAMTASVAMTFFAGGAYTVVHFGAVPS